MQISLKSSKVTRKPFAVPRMYNRCIVVVNASTRHADESIVLFVDDMYAQYVLKLFFKEDEEMLLVQNQLKSGKTGFPVPH